MHATALTNLAGETVQVHACDEERGVWSARVVTVARGRFLYLLGATAAPEWTAPGNVVQVCVERRGHRVLALGHVVKRRGPVVAVQVESAGEQDNRRRTFRVAVDVAADLTTDAPGAATSRALLHDLSATGARLTVDTFAGAVGAPLTLGFRVAGSEFALRAHVVRVRRTGPQVQLGVAFDECSSATEAALLRTLFDLQRRDRARIDARAVRAEAAC